MPNVRTFLILAVMLAGMASPLSSANVFSVFKTNAKTGKQADDLYLLPTSQTLHPWGEQILVRGRPVDIAFDAAGERIGVLNSKNVLLIDAQTHKQIRRFELKSTSYTGIAFRPGTNELWASEATRKGPDALIICDPLAKGSTGKVFRVEFAKHPVPAGLAFSADGKTVYVAFSRNNSLGVVNADTRKLEREIPVGMAPFGVVVSKKTGRVFVSNRAGRRPRSGDTVAPSSGSDVVSDPDTGATTVGTVGVIDPNDGSVREINVGLAPSKMSFSPDEATLAVANSHSDSVTLIDTTTLATTELKVPA